jgi:hypothetical protein
LDDDALAGAHDEVARELARRVPEQAVEHVRARELHLLAVEPGDVGDELRLDAPDRDQIRRRDPWNQ